MVIFTRKGIGTQKFLFSSLTRRLLTNSRELILKDVHISLIIITERLWIYYLSDLISLLFNSLSELFWCVIGISISRHIKHHYLFLSCSKQSEMCGHTFFFLHYFVRTLYFSSVHETFISSSKRFSLSSFLNEDAHVDTNFLLFPETFFETFFLFLPQSKKKMTTILLKPVNRY